MQTDVDLDSFYVAQKELAINPDWVVTARKDYADLVSPLDIDGVTMAGLAFRARARIELPDRQVAFQLEYSPSTSQPKGGPICRLDWRPFQAHNNKNCGPPEYRMIAIRGTHLHDFHLNWAYSPKRVRNGILDIAVPVADMPFEKALEFVEKQFRIKGVALLPPPPWSARLI
ncbi:hypothetical protein GCM10007315_29200 [Gemmobacter tilapiae]|uniref:Uncharacterized protein n=2 Tax=Neogemmobacter tilapiae TaxID=875041 RepID=A0A918TVI2_9RHOB|nr:hypothetical protein GCM10007315_29200 [Gemmobacter tilapiae]